MKNDFALKGHLSLVHVSAFPWKAVNFFTHLSLQMASKMAKKKLANCSLVAHFPVFAGITQEHNK